MTTMGYQYKLMEEFKRLSILSIMEQGLLIPIMVADPGLIYDIITSSSSTAYMGGLGSEDNCTTMKRLLPDHLNVPAIAIINSGHSKLDMHHHLSGQAH